MQTTIPSTNLSRMVPQSEPESAAKQPTPALKASSQEKPIRMPMDMMTFLMAVSARSAVTSKSCRKSRKKIRAKDPKDTVRAKSTRWVGVCGFSSAPPWGTMAVRSLWTAHSAAKSMHHAKHMDTTVCMMKYQRRRYLPMLSNSTEGAGIFTFKLMMTETTVRTTKTMAPPMIFRMWSTGSSGASWLASCVSLALWCRSSPTMKKTSVCTLRKERLRPPISFSASSPWWAQRITMLLASAWSPVTSPSLEER
mmetsp:Transcript_63246/g.175349  ORF Transcript_63246/g.175349 Transcript_63246/m.175349 type:complete len:252 (+) Transcript_63246:196-951(+)